MLKTLLKKQMAEIFRNYFYDPKKNKIRSRGATIAYIALYALLMVGLLGGMFALMAVGLCGPLVEGGMGWLYYLLMGLIAVFLGTFGSVFSTYSSLYLSKDNDLLLSLPIPVRCVMASRLLGVYLLGLMYAAVVIVPGVIVYWLTAPVTAGTIVGGVLMVLIVSVIVMVLSCLLGWVVARISLKLKNKSFITVLLSLLFLAAYYFVYYKAQALITLLVENAAVYGMKIRGSAYLLYLFGSVGAGDWLAMGIVTVTQAALLALTLWGIARSFLKIATATGSVKKVRFEHRAVRAQSVQRALFGKELRRFTASPNYMLNCGLGILMLPVAGIVLLIKGGALGRMLADVFSGNVGVVPVLMCAAVCLLASMNDMAAPAVSLEGRNLWLVQSLPVVLKLKNKSFITVLLSLLFLAAYYFVYYKAQALITLLVENAAVYGMKIRGSAYLLYLFGSVGAGDWLAMGIVTVTQAALLALTLWGIARSFLKIATATGSVKKVRFEHRAVRAQSVQRALFGKELRRFTASPNYMLNCGLGILMLPVAGIVLLIKGGALGRMLADVFSGNVGVVPVLMCAAVCLLASMNDMAAPAVSLEGRNLWLVQSLPVVPWQALRAKLDVQLVLTGVPVLFCALCMVIALPGSALEKALLVIVTLLYTLLSALAALALGLKMPNLTWTNETTPIKQSGCVMLSLFANWFYALALGGLYFLCGNALSAAVYLAIFAVVTAAGSALLLRWVKKQGARIFAAL